MTATSVRRAVVLFNRDLRLSGAAVHRPLALPAETKAGLRYPEPIVDIDGGRSGGGA